MFEFYQNHTPMTMPGDAQILESLPHDPFSLSNIVGGLVLNFKTDRVFINDETYDRHKYQVDLRECSKMILELQKMKDIPLYVARKYSDRLVCNCRDSALLLCCFLREKGYPARVRYGFAHHCFSPHLPLHEHTVVEFLHEGEWVFFDPRIERFSKLSSDKGNKLSNPIPRKMFMTGLETWKAARRSCQDMTDLGRTEKEILFFVGKPSM